jgi:HlyD family secretion protein
MEATVVSDGKVSVGNGSEHRAALPMLIVERGQAAVTTPGPIRRAFRVIRFIPLVMALVMTGGVIGMYFQPPGLKFIFATFGLQPGGGTSSPIAVPAPRQPAAAPAAPRVVVGLGKLLPEGDVITIAPPFGAGDARIARLEVSEGQHVAPGDVLATLDSERTFRAALDLARANLASREAALAQTRAAVSASRDEARAALARAEAVAQNAAREFERSEQLRRSGFSADQAYERSRTARDETEREVERLRATLSRYGADLDRQPDVLVAARALDAARADVERATADVEKALVRAPLDATVLTIKAQPGEKPGVDGIMTIGAIDRMRADVEVYQNQIGLIAPGDAVEITAEALGRKLTGRVQRIGLEIARQTLVDPSPAASTDARVVKVTVALDADSQAFARRFTNLQVIARIAVGRDAT